MARVKHDLKYVLKPFSDKASIVGLPNLESLPTVSLLGDLAIDHFTEDEQLLLKECFTKAHAKRLTVRGTASADLKH